MTRLATSWIEASPNPSMEPRMSRWFAASSLTSERHQGRNLLTSASHHHENQAASLGCCGVVEVTDALLGAVAGVAVGSSGALRTELLATDGHAPIH